MEKQKPEYSWDSYHRLQEHLANIETLHNSLEAIEAHLQSDLEWNDYPDNVGVAEIVYKIGDAKDILSSLVQSGMEKTSALQEVLLNQENENGKQAYS